MGTPIIVEIVLSVKMYNVKLPQQVRRVPRIGRSLPGRIGLAELVLVDPQKCNFLRKK